MPTDKYTWEQQYQCVNCKKLCIILNANGDEICPFCHSPQIIRGTLDNPEENRFKTGELTTDAFKVIMHDLECLELVNTDDNKYHYDLLKSNLKDIFGKTDRKV